MLPSVTGRNFTPGVTVFHHTDRPKPADNRFNFFLSKLVLQPITNGLVYATLSLNRLARHLLTICKKIFATNE